MKDLVDEEEKRRQQWWTGSCRGETKVVMHLLPEADNKNQEGKD